jgi:hypothetical protein
MRRMLPYAALILTAAAAAPALAEEANCGSAPREQWLSEEAIKAKGTEMGYEVRRVKAEGGCYELYAVDKSGAKAELYFNPVTGALVNRSDED